MTTHSINSPHPSPGKWWAHEPYKTLWVLLFFVLATGVMLYPLSIRLADHVPDWGDPLEYTWTLAWGGQTLIADPLKLYDANIFYPYPNSLAFSESQIASAVTGLPLLLATGNPILAYNFVFLAAFALAGFNAYLLAYDLTHSRGGSLIAGFAFAFWAYKFNHLSHINLITLQWLPLVLFALRRSLARDRIVFPILFGVTFALQALSSWYSALMLVLLAGLYVLYALVFHPSARKVSRLAALSICFGFAVVPIVLIGLPYFQVSRELQFARSLGEAERLSARPLSFLSVAPFNLLYQSLLPKGVGDALFPGALMLVLTLSGLRRKFKFPDRPFWILTIVLFTLIAFGPVFQLTATLKPPSPLYLVLYDFVPGFQGTRAPARFFVVSMLGIALVAANGFGSFTRNLRPTSRAILTVGALGVLAAESIAIPIRLDPIETGASIPQVYAWLGSQPPGNILELPTSVGDVIPITRAMYYSLSHRRSMPVGYASFIPPTQNDFLQTLNAALAAPSPRLTNLLTEFGVRYLILNRDAQDAAKLEPALAQVPAFQLAYRDESNLVYRIDTVPPPHPLQFGCLAPAFAAPNSPYTLYLTVQHTRRYPIVNSELESLAFAVEWRDQTGKPIIQTQTLRLPYVLPERPSGVPVQVTAPPQPGTYVLTCTLGDRQLEQAQSVHVVPKFQSNDGSPLLELLDAKFIQDDVHRGSEIIGTLYWRRRAEVRAPVSMLVQLVAEDGSVISEIKREPVLYTYPVRLWRDDELVADSYALPVPADAADGNYHVEVRAVDTGTGDPMPFRSPLGETGIQFATPAFPIR